MNLAFLETAVLLRVPPQIADHLYKQLHDKEASASISGIMNLHVLDGASGAMTLRMGTQALSGQVVDLPSVIEAHKTFNGEMYYKVADIGKMIVVQNTHPAQLPPPPPPVDYPHGLLPPTREIRTKRYERNTKPPVRAYRGEEKGKFSYLLTQRTLCALCRLLLAGHPSRSGRVTDELARQPACAYL
jgi:TATA-binding protein-associated factor Taf7